MQHLRHESGQHNQTLVSSAVGEAAHSKNHWWFRKMTRCAVDEFLPALPEHFGRTQSVHASLVHMSSGMLETWCIMKSLIVTFPIERCHAPEAVITALTHPLSLFSRSNLCQDGEGNLEERKDGVNLALFRGGGTTLPPMPRDSDIATGRYLSSALAYPKSSHEADMCGHERKGQRMSNSYIAQFAG